MKKRITALFLLVCMLLTLLPVGALADEDEGSPTPAPVVEPAPPQNEGGEGGSGTGGSTGGNGSTHTHTWGAWTDTGDTHTRKCTDTACNATENGAHDYAYTSNGDGTHTGKCKTCGKTLDPEACSGGTATCKEKAKCAKCGGSYGDLSTEHKLVYRSNSNGTHNVVCEVCNQVQIENEKCSGGVATCTEKAKCDKCGESYGDVNPHNHKEAAAPRHVGDADNKEHEYYCELCDASLRKEKCSKTPATCVTPATCTKCGQSYGDVSTKHEWVWKSNGDGTHTLFCKYCNEQKDNVAKSCTKASKPRHIKGTETHEDYCKDCGASMGSAEDCTKKYQPTKNGTHKVLCTECGATLGENVPCTSDPSTERCGQKAYCQYCYQDFGDKLPHDFSSGGGCARFPEGRCSCTKASHRKLWNTTNASQSTVYCDKCHTDVEKEKIRADFTVSNYKLGKPVSSLKVSTSSAHVKVKNKTVSPDSGNFDANQVYSVTVEFTTDPGYEVTYATIGGSTATLTDSHNAAVANLPKFGTEFTVTYNNMGHGKPKKTSEKVTYPGTVKPETLSEKGYVFGGWYMDRECTKAFKASVPVASDMTLYAKWSEARTLTFKANSGKISPSSKNFADGEVVNLKDYTPTRSGYWFCGWFKDSKLTGRKLETIKMDANKTVYAKWKKEDTTNPKTGDTIGLAVGVLALTTVLGAAVVTKKKRTR